MTTRTTVRVSALLAATALALSSCTVPWFRDAVDEFVAAFNAGDDAGAATLSDDPARAAADLEQLRAGIGGTSVELDAGGEEDGATEITATWTVPNGDESTTTGTITLSEQDSDLITWDKRIFSTELNGDSRFLYSDDKTFTLPVTDRNGTDILSWTPVTVVSAGPELIPRAGEIAAAVRPVVPTSTAESVTAQIESGDGSPVGLFTLRERDFAVMGDALRAIEGLDLREEGRMLGPTRDTASPVDGGLRDYWSEKITADAGWTLQATSPTGTTILGQVEPAESEPVRTTMDLGVQTAAKRALEPIEQPAAIVALSASTGGVIAVAQNDAADALGPVSLSGLYPPGSTFKTVTTAAALERGTVVPDSTVACPATAEIDGRVIPNDGNFALGDVSMTQAFAQSCNTTQGFISQDLEPDDMRNTAARLGLGVDFTAPGMTTVTGSVPVTEPGAARVEAAIGQGEVLSSPFGLAVMEASLGNNGRMVLPTLIQGEETTADQDPEPLDPATVRALRAMMAETVDSGTAASLSDIDGLGGKTGTAEVGGNRPAHGWFAGIKGDLAFCTFVAGAESSGPAVAATGRFLRDDAMSEWR
ncbi:penicillin-binding transpeptidase domain-containing protein [Corynebacterium faecale]|uniref:Cell division protein FtsI/penicillin-binding protein 2 n=1 Tax=Corynebacterium pollutisoli TaxID=1610489 RepID=A0A1X7HXX7_9CORY|nr:MULTISPECIES: penicillin-binding transpeptidase domain-containing protein [Corynebacterium]NLT53159.1 penicillin-binding protein [Actinomycetales bacterium]SMG06747.1 Cell division protein FtsI/penicillin-binding protein 2 [Corynebacterium pollutisoli]